MTASPQLCIVPPPLQGPGRDPYTLEKLVRRLVKTYGVRNVRWLIRDFERNAPVVTSAHRLGASVRRVQEWKDMLGSTISCYVVHEDAQLLVDEQTE